MRREFVCPRCGLVLEANAVEGVVWMGKHVATCQVPERAVFTAIDAPTLQAMPPVPDLLIHGDRAWMITPSTGELPPYLPDPPLAFTWRETLSLDDAEFLHGLGIDPL